MSTLTNLNLNGNLFDLGSGFTNDVKNCLTICLYKLAWNTEDADVYINNLINAMNTTPLDYTTVVENYEPDGNPFSFGSFYIDFENGDYVEALIDTTDFTINGGILLSVGTQINLWGGYNWHFPSYPTHTIQAYDTGCNAFAGSVSDRDVTYYKSGEDFRLIKIDKNNVYVNGYPVFDTTVNHSALVDAITPNTQIYIGSTQGNARSNALYKYIRIYRGA